MYRFISIFILLFLSYSVLASDSLPDGVVGQKLDTLGRLLIAYDSKYAKKQGEPILKRLSTVGTEAFFVEKFKKDCKKVREEKKKQKLESDLRAVDIKLVYVDSYGEKIDLIVHNYQNLFERIRSPQLSSFVPSAHEAYKDLMKDRLSSRAALIRLFSILQKCFLKRIYKCDFEIRICNLNDLAIKDEDVYALKKRLVIEEIKKRQKKLNHYMKQALSHDNSFSRVDRENTNLTFLRAFINRILDDVDSLIIDKLETSGEIFKRRGLNFETKWIWEQRLKFYKFYYEDLKEIIDAFHPKGIDMNVIDFFPKLGQRYHKVYHESAFYYFGC